MAVSPIVQNLKRLAEDIFRQIRPFTEMLDNVQAVTNRSSAALETFNGEEILKSPNEAVEQIRRLANQWNNMLIPFLAKSRDENYWMEWSGVNMFNKATIGLAIGRLSGVNAKLKALNNSVSALKSVASSLSAIQAWDDKAGYALAPDIAILDAMSLRDTLTELDAVRANAMSVDRKILNCTNALQKFR